MFTEPNKGEFNLNIQNNAGSQVSIELFDTKSKNLFSKEYNSNKNIDFEDEIKLQNIPSGVYWLKIQNTYQTTIRKIVIL